MRAMNGARRAALLGVIGFACSSTAAERPYRSPDDPPESAAAPGMPQAAPVVDQSDAPEISRSVGSAGGVLVMWPRIVTSRSGPPKPDAETRAIAQRLQARLAELARRAAAGKSVELRPEPERVCPRSGCKAVTVGLLLARAGKGCAAAALISGPGTAPARVVPWLAGMTANRASVPFREPPEVAVDVSDYLPCSDVGAAQGSDDDVVKALGEVLK
jgi:hypothetical protein